MRFKDPMFRRSNLCYKVQTTQIEEVEITEKISTKESKIYTKENICGDQATSAISMMRAFKKGRNQYQT